MSYLKRGDNSERTCKVDEIPVVGLHNELWHEIPINLVCATSKGSDQPAHTRSLIRAFASSLSIL